MNSLTRDFCDKGGRVLSGWEDLYLLLQSINQGLFLQVDILDEIWATNGIACLSQVLWLLMLYEFKVYHT